LSLALPRAIESFLEASEGGASFSAHRRLSGFALLDEQFRGFGGGLPYCLHEVRVQLAVLDRDLSGPTSWTRARSTDAYKASPPTSSRRSKGACSISCDLPAEEWSRQTVAPRWTVKDVAAHLLDTAPAPRLVPRRPFLDRYAAVDVRGRGAVRQRSKRARRRVRRPAEHGPPDLAHGGRLGREMPRTCSRWTRWLPHRLR
jgi:hypothetical protein